MIKRKQNKLSNLFFFFIYLFFNKIIIYQVKYRIKFS